MSKKIPFQIKIGDYLIERELGSGGFGVVYKGVHLLLNKAVAIKLEQRDPEESGPSKLFKEYEIYKLLDGNKGICKCHEFMELEGYDALVIDYKGPSLSHMFNLSDRKFSLKTTLLIMLQILNRLELVHSKGYIYRDVKPGNFILQTRRGKGKVFLIDFGLIRSYLAEGTNNHVSYERQSFAGTAQFAPLNAHLSKAQSRRDDLESLGYMCVYFMKGTLPWNKVKTKDKRERKRQIGNMKLATNVETLCEGLPPEFKTYMKYVKDLGFEEKPDYTYLKRLMLGLMKKNGFEFDYKYDWVSQNVQKLELETPKIKIIPNKQYVPGLPDRK
jgi:serine/threonine protein kinase